MNSSSDIEQTAPSKAGPPASHDEESLPLYQDIEATPPPLPPKDASPDEVRDFLHATLTVRSSMNSATARSVSDKWEFGTGAELRAYPVNMYRDVFGAEAAWILYRAVRPMVLREKRLEKQCLRMIACITSGVAAILFIMIVTSSISSENPAMLLFVLPVPFAIVGFCKFGYDLVRSPEAQVKNDLKNSFSPLRQHPSGQHYVYYGTW